MKKLPILFIGLGALVACGGGFTKPKVITGITASANPTSVASAGSSSLTATLEITGTDNSVNENITWSIVAGGGNLSATSSANKASITYTAPTVSSDITAIIKATSAGDPTKTQDVSVNIIAPKILSINASANPTGVASAGSSTLTASVTGTGAFNNNISWSIISGGGSLSASSSLSGATVTYTAPVLSSAGITTIRATSAGDSSKTTDVTVNVAAVLVPSFGVAVTPNPITANFAFMKTNVTVTPINGFNGTVALSLLNAPNIKLEPSSVVISGSSAVTVPVELVTDASATQTFASFFTLPAVTNATLRGESAGITREVPLGYQQQKGVQFGYGDTSPDTFRSLDISSDGSLVIVGETLTNVPVPFAPNFRSDAVLIKYNPNGTEAWRRQFSGQTSLTAAFRGVTVASNGDIFVVGGQYRLVGNAYNFQPLVAKYSADGNQIWVVPIEINWGDGYGIHLDSSGNLVIVGYILNGVFPNSGLISGFGVFDGYVAKLSSSHGSIIWAKQLGTSVNEEFLTVDLDASNNIITGYSSEGNFSGTSAGGRDCIFMKLNSSGTELWRKQFGGAGKDFCFPRFDNSGNVLVPGTMNRDSPSEDAFVRKYDGNGNLLWNNDVVTSAADFGAGAISDVTGNVYLLGETQGNISGSNQGNRDVFLIKHNSSGVEQWRKQYGASGDETAGESWNGMVIDSSGNLIFMGLVGANFSATARDGFIIKLGR